MDTKYSSSEEYHTILGIVIAEHLQMQNFTVQKLQIFQIQILTKKNMLHIDISLLFFLLYLSFNKKFNEFFYFDFTVIHYNYFIKMGGLDYVLTSL